MSNRITSRRRLKKYSVGDMRERITIHTRTITAPTYDSVSITESYDVGVERWASVETLDKKRQMFSSVNIPEGSTHSIIIRYDSTFTAENIIAWRGEYYDILKTSDPDGRKQYLEFFCRVKGDDGLAVNT